MAPDLDLDSTALGTGAALTYLENAFPTVIAPNATVTDSDSPDFDTGSLTVSIGAGGSADDRLGIDTSGTVSVVGGTVSVGGVDIGTLTGDPSSGGDLVVTFNGNATAALVQTLMRAITFEHLSDAPDATSRTVTFTLDDGDGDTSFPDATVDITAVNDAPALDLDFVDFTATGNNAAATWAEGDAAVVLAPYAVFTDDDADNSYDGATVTATFSANGTSDDQLGILSVGDGTGEIRVDGSNIYYEGNLVGSFTGGDDGNELVVTFNATACHCAVEMVIASLTFSNTSDTPDTTDRTVTITLVDGGGVANSGADTASADVTVSISAGNDAPTVVITPPELIADGAETDIIPSANAYNTQDKPILATLADGSFVVVYESRSEVGDDLYGVYAQRFDADGTPIGSQFRVNSYVASNQASPTVAALANGGFVITWMSTGQDGSLQGIYAQRYDAAGVADGGEFQVNTTTVARQRVPVIAGLDDGGFVIVWEDLSSGTYQIKAQLYDANGDPVGTEFQISDTSRGDVPSVTALAGGGFAVAWQTGEGSSSAEAYVRQFDADGNAIAASLQVSSTGGSLEGRVSIDALADGGYVVTYQSSGPDGSGYGVFAQRYDASGAVVGSPFQVNTTTAGDQLEPVVTGLADGGFVIAWYSSDGSGYGIYAQRYAADGSTLGDEFRLNATTGNTQAFPALAALDDGGLVAAWQHNLDGTSDQTGNFDIMLQRYDAAFAATEGVALDLKGSIALGDLDAGSDIISVTLSVDYGYFTVDAGTSGATVDDSIPYEIIITGTLAQIQALLGGDPTSVVTYVTEDIDPPATAELSITIDDGMDIATDTATIAITAVDSPPELDLDFFESGTGATAHYIEGDAPTYLAFYATFDDDNADWDGATLTVAITGATSDDQLTIDDVGTGPGELSLDGSDVLYEGVVIGTWSGGTNGAPLTITYNADACACAIELTAASILYASSGTDLAPSSRDVDFTFVDGSDTVTATSVLEVVPVQSPPDIDTGGDGAAHQATSTAITGIVITDAGDPVSGLLTVQLIVENGTLTVRTDVPGGIDATQIVNTGIPGRGITIVATPDQINATLAATNGLTYLGDADFYGADSLTIQAYDGIPASPFSISSLSALPFGAIPSAVAFTDLDGDQLDDIVLGFADPFGTDPGFALVLASGPVGGFALDAGAPEAFAFGDFDGDGTIDVAFAAYLDDGSSYIGYASSLTGDVETIAAIPYALDLVTGDFDGNGLLDFAVADSDNGRVGIVLQTAAGVFASPVYTAGTSLLTVSVVTGDFNGDGVIDVLSANFGVRPGYDAPGSVDLLFGNGDGTFAAPAQIVTGPSNVDGLVVGDFNNDGFDDFAFASVDSGEPGAVSGVQVVLGNGDGTFAAPVAYATSAGGEPHQLVAGDVNGDGIDDLVVANFDDPGTVSILVGNGDGSFQAAVGLDTGDLPYVLALGDPDGDGDLDLMVGNYGDGTYEAFNNDSFHSGTTAVKTINVNGLSVAVDDSTGSTAENATVVIDVVANDTDPEGDTRSVASIAGIAATIGVAVTLASGATATLNSDGTITYDPNGAFNSLLSVAKAGFTGGVNTSAVDSFTYTLANGGTATVSVTVNGVDSADDVITGSAGNNVLSGYPGNDFFRADQGGDDRVAGGGGDDTAYFGAEFTTADTFKGGPGSDTLILQGDYSSMQTLANVFAAEMLVLMSASNTRYGASGTGSNSYSFTPGDALVVAGTQFTVQGNGLQTGETLHFNGSAETDGSFRLIGGAADDVLTGGAKDDTLVGGLGVDTLSGGLGNDLFVYRTTAESTTTSTDEILDFNAGDRIDLRTIDANLGGGNDAFAFIGSDGFHNVAGELRAELSGGVWTVQGDVDGDGNADFQVHVQTSGGHSLVSGDFYL